MSDLKFDYFGVVGGIMALVSPLLPWWTMTMAIEGLPRVFSIYTYQATYSVLGEVISVNENLWYGHAVLALVLAGGFLEIAGSLIRYRRLIYVGMLFAVFAVSIFPVGLETNGHQLFSAIASGEMPYSSYLSFGYWLAVGAAVVPLLSRFVTNRKTESITPLDVKSTVG